ncbi:hypothetical protein HK102_009313, partial [Quaeritorhiza haematococci]
MHDDLSFFTAYIHREIGKRKNQLEQQEEDRVEDKKERHMSRAASQAELVAKKKEEVSDRQLKDAEKKSMLKQKVQQFLHEHQEQRQRSATETLAKEEAEQATLQRAAEARAMIERDEAEKMRQKHEMEIEMMEREEERILWRRRRLQPELVEKRRKLWDEEADDLRTLKSEIAATAVDVSLPSDANRKPQESSEGASVKLESTVTAGSDANPVTPPSSERHPGDHPTNIVIGNSTEPAATKDEHTPAKDGSADEDDSGSEYHSFLTAEDGGASYLDESIDFGGPPSPQLVPSRTEKEVEDGGASELDESIDFGPPSPQLVPSEVLLGFSQQPSLEPKSSVSQASSPTKNKSNTTANSTVDETLLSERDAPKSLRSLHMAASVSVAPGSENIQIKDDVTTPSTEEFVTPQKGEATPDSEEFATPQKQEATPATEEFTTPLKEEASPNTEDFTTPQSEEATPTTITQETELRADPVSLTVSSGIINSSATTPFAFLDPTLDWLLNPNEATPGNLTGGFMTKKSMTESRASSTNDSTTIKMLHRTGFVPLSFDHSMATPRLIEHLLSCDAGAAQADQSEDGPEHDSSVTKKSSSPAPPFHVLASWTVNRTLRTHCALVHRSVLGYFLRELNAQAHLEVMRRYFLLGDGCFVRALSEVLFEGDGPVDMSGDSKTLQSLVVSTGRTAALGVDDTQIAMSLMTKDKGRIGLNGRYSWPADPGVLGSALREAIAASALEQDDGAVHGEEDLVRNVYRNLHDSLVFGRAPGADKMNDPSDLEALSIVDLIFIPPRPLDILITNTSMDKYRQIWSFLMKILRVQESVNRILTSRWWQHTRGRYKGDKYSWRWPGYNTAEDIAARRFRFEAEGFVCGLARYVFDDSVNKSWKSFMAAIDEVQRQMDYEDSGENVPSSFGSEFVGTDPSTNDDDERHGTPSRNKIRHLESFVALHHATLDRILWKLLLKRRQATVLKVVEGMLQLILKFSRLVCGRYRGFWGANASSFTTSTSIIGGTLANNSSLHIRTQSVVEMYAKFRKYYATLVKGLRILIERGTERVADEGVDTDNKTLADEDVKGKAGRRHADGDRQSRNSKSSGGVAKYECFEELLLLIDGNSFVENTM